MLAIALAGVLAAGSDPPENAWVRISPSEGKPIPRFGWEGSGALDPEGRRWIHQGGHDGNPQGFALFTLDLATRTWTQKFPNTSPPGSCCVDGANVFDPAHRRFVRFPGAALGHGWQWSRKVKMKGSPVWLYDPEADAWTNMRPPPYREPEKYSRLTLGSLNAGATYDPNHEVAISFGGQTSGGGTNSLFVYDAWANRLERLAGENPPDPRDGHGICYDAKNDALVVFGSQYGSDERVWLYRFKTGRWEAAALDPHPPARKGKTYSTIPKMAFDSRNGICLAIVWDDATGNHQTWTLDLAARSWTRMNPAREPDPSQSRSRNLAYWAEENLFILELTGKNRGPEIWVYRYRNAPPVRPAPGGLALATEPSAAALSWKPVEGAAEYRVYRAEAAEPWKTEYTRVAAVKETSFRDAGLSAGGTYFYRVAAVAADGTESASSFSARTQPRVLLRPVVSVLAPARIEVSWNPHPAPDVAGYHVYRGLVTVASVKKGAPGPWKDNDPEYAEPQVVAVRDIGPLARLTEAPLAGTTFVDTGADLDKKGEASGDYRFAVYAYLVRAVNRLGTESGPSPYALTIPSEPERVMCRETPGGAELRWEPSRQKGIAGYLVYEISDREITRVTPELLKECRFARAARGTRRYSVVAVDALGQEGQPSSPAWYNHKYSGFFEGEWHQ